MFAFRRISWKLVLVFLLILVCGNIMIGSYAIYHLNGKIVSAAQEKLKSDLAIAKVLFDDRAAGPWNIRDNRLYKGNTPLEGIDIVDAFSKMTGDNITVFLADTRIATSVRTPDGKKATGTKAAPEVALTVLKNRETFLGKAQVVGVLNQAIYEPIVADGGEVIGMFFVGVPNTPYEAMAAEFEASLAIFVFLEAVLAGVIIFFLARRITKPLERLANIAGVVASGNLSVTIETRTQDEVGQLAESMRRMIASLSLLIRKVTLTTEQVAASSQQLAATSKQSSQASHQVADNVAEMARGAEVQLKAVDESSALISHMSDRLRHIGTNVQGASGTCQKTSQAAMDGHTALYTAIRQMQIIENTVVQSSGVVARLGEKSKEIGQIVDAISSIAGQTNLLALNAAIEAARAGEHGRGFAVVADEVRKLAEQSQASAEQIAQLIRDIQVETDKAVTAMDQGTREVKTGGELAESAGQAFTQITSLIEQVATQVELMAADITNMERSSEQVVAAVERIHGISREAVTQTHSVSAATEEQSAAINDVASSSQALAQLADDLQHAVAQFSY